MLNVRCSCSFVVVRACPPESYSRRWIIRCKKVTHQSIPVRQPPDRTVRALLLLPYLAPLVVPGLRRQTQFTKDRVRRALREDSIGF